MAGPEGPATSQSNDCLDVLQEILGVHLDVQSHDQVVDVGVTVRLKLIVVGAQRMHFIRPFEGIAHPHLLPVPQGSNDGVQVFILLNEQKAFAGRRGWARLRSTGLLLQYFQLPVGISHDFERVLFIVTDPFGMRAILRSVSGVNDIGTDVNRIKPLFHDGVNFSLSEIGRNQCHFRMTSNEHAIMVEQKLGCCSHVVLQNEVRDTPHRDVAPSGLDQFGKLRKGVQVLHRWGDIPNITFDVAVFIDKITEVLGAEAMSVIRVDHIQNGDHG